MYVHIRSFVCFGKNTHFEWKFGIARNFQTVPYLQLVGYKEHRLAFGDTPDSFMEDVVTHTSINSAERVIQEKYGPLTVEGTCQAHSLTLPSTQVGTSLSNLERESKKTKLHKKNLSSSCGCTKLQTVTYSYIQ